MKQMWSKEELEKLPKNIDTLVDSAGNPRFIEGEGTTPTSDKIEISYCKWSLSGTHLMLVISGMFKNDAVFAVNEELASFDVGAFIYNKIYPTFSNIVEIKSILAYKDDWSIQTMGMQLRKIADTTILKIQSNGLTLNADRTFRVQFDLLIDSE